VRKSDDDILGREIGRAGELGGGIGGKLGGIVAAKLLPTDTFVTTIAVRANAGAVVSMLSRILATEGAVLRTDASPEAFELKGLIHAGFFNMNPAIIIIQVEQTEPETASVRITGKAKEGLIKQHTAEKAVRRIADRLMARMGQALHILRE
jgi:hypothetical protein